MANKLFSGSERRDETYTRRNLTNASSLYAMYNIMMGSINVASSTLPHPLLSLLNHPQHPQPSTTSSTIHNTLNHPQYPQPSTTPSTSSKLHETDLVNLMKSLRHIIAEFHRKQTGPGTRPRIQKGRLPCLISKGRQVNFWRSNIHQLLVRE